MIKDGDEVSFVEVETLSLPLGPWPDLAGQPSSLHVITMATCTGFPDLLASSQQHIGVQDWDEGGAWEHEPGEYSTIRRAKDP